MIQGTGIKYFFLCACVCTPAIPPIFKQCSTSHLESQLFASCFTRLQQLEKESQVRELQSWKNCKQLSASVRLA